MQQYNEQPATSENMHPEKIILVPKQQIFSMHVGWWAPKSPTILPEWQNHLVLWQWARERWARAAYLRDRVYFGRARREVKVARYHWVPQNLVRSWLCPLDLAQLFCLCAAYRFISSEREHSVSSPVLSRHLSRHSHSTMTCHTAEMTREIRQHWPRLLPLHKTKARDYITSTELSSDMRLNKYHSLHS